VGFFTEELQHRSHSRPHTGKPHLTVTAPQRAASTHQCGGRLPNETQTDAFKIMLAPMAATADQ